MKSSGALAQAKVGDRFETGPRVVTGTELDMFCSVAGLRLDPFLLDEAAQQLGFKGRVVPGPFLFGLVFGLAGDLLNGLVHVGTEKLKVLAPVHPNDRVRLEVLVVDKKKSSKPGKGFLTWAWALKNQEDVVVIQGENT
jgi:acyl dehydratase